MRVLPYPCPEHEENIVMEVPCTDCNFEDCQNKLMPQVAAARASSFIPSQDGLFAVQDVEAGTLVASFGPVKRVNREDRPKLGYKIPIRETGTRRVEWVTPCNGGSSEYKAHFINHTCSSRHVNVEFTHPGELGKDARVWARATRDLLAGEEMFADYGEGFTFEDSVCLCHQCGHGGRNKPR